MPDVKNGFPQLLYSSLRKCVLQEISGKTQTQLSEKEDGAILSQHN